MKNTTKKILSVLLTAIMLLSAIPVAFAAEDSLREAYLEEVTRLWTYDKNIYEDDEYFHEYVILPAINELEEELGFSYMFAFSNKEWAVADNDDVTAATEGIREVNEMIESKIANGEATLIIDSSALTKVAIRFAALYNDRGTEETFQHIENSEIGISLINRIPADEAKLSELISAGTCTQADYDELTASYICFHELIMHHMDGEHDFDEYISNNDATETADGTKTATCEFCGATDTVIDEGSKLGSAEDNCSCSCHKTGISGFFWKILRFFYQLFGTNKLCGCGAAHY